MKNHNMLGRAQWSSYPSYLLVTIGAVVGLGNIFTFPFLVAKFGGLFLLFYVLSEILISIPLLLTELLIGRRGKQNPVGSISILALESDVSTRWRYLGWLSFFIVFLSLSYYIVSVAFPVDYFFQTIQSIYHQGTASLSLIDTVSLTQRPVALGICFLFFLIVTLLVIVRGINRGLEEISKITVPLYFIILLGLAIYSCSLGNSDEALAYLFHINSSQALFPVFFAAFVYAFFKLNVGMGSMIVYGSYLPYSVPLVQSTFIVVIVDAIISLLSYFIIYPLLLNSHFTQDQALSFTNINMIFLGIPHGLLIGALFFFAAIVAAWTPTIAMAETAVVTLVERFNISRLKATLLIGVGIALISSWVVYAKTLGSEIMLMDKWPMAMLVEDIAANLATPIAAFFTAIFCGWVINRNIPESELHLPPPVFSIWRGLIRYLVPIVVVAIYLRFI